MNHQTVNRVALCLLLCGGLLGGCVRGSGAVDSALSDSGNDVLMDSSPMLSFDVPPVDAAACAPNFLLVEYKIDGGPTVSTCLALDEGITLNYDASGGHPCPIISTEAQARTSEGANFFVTGADAAFSTVGMQPLNFGAMGLAADGLCGGQDASGCYYQAAAPSCRFVVTLAGNRGDVVEAHLLEPCIVSDNADPPAPPTMMLRNLVVHGTLVDGRTTNDCTGDCEDMVATCP